MGAEGQQRDLGFGGQWVEIFGAGPQIDNQGRIHIITRENLQQVVSNFNPGLHEPPAVIGHPEHDKPAHGWTHALRLNGDKLEAQFVDCAPGFEELVQNGMYKKRSASFYIDPMNGAWKLRHVGFLGAAPPSVKGLRNIQFSEGESITFDFSEDEATMKDEEVKGLADRIIDGIKSLLPGKKDDPPASFSESDLTKRIGDAVKAATEPLTASFNEQLKQRDERITELTKRVESQGVSATRAEIIAFCDSLGKEKCPPAFRNMGIVEFMESLATVPAENKVTVIEFSEKDGKTVETKTESAPLEWFKGFLKGLPTFISFGEQFGSITANDPQAGAPVSLERRNELREKAGLPAKEGGKS